MTTNVTLFTLKLLLLNPYTFSCNYNSYNFLIISGKKKKKLLFSSIKCLSFTSCYEEMTERSMLELAGHLDRIS